MNNQIPIRSRSVLVIFVILFTLAACGLSEEEIAATSVAATATAASPTPTKTKTPISTSTPIPTLTLTPTPTLTARRHFSIGVEHQDKDEFELALEEFDKAIEMDPTFVDAYFERGRTYALMGNFLLAIEEWSQVINLDPDNFDALLYRAFAYDDAGEFENAVADYDRVIQLDPLFGEAFYWRGIGYAYLGQTKTAISDIERALQLGVDPEIEQAAQFVLDELERLITGQISFDGYWSGNTDQGEVIFIEIENNGIVSYGTGFQIPGCETLTPYWAFGGQPQGFVEGNSFFIDGSFARVAGTFTTGSSAFGTLDIDCEGGLSTTWNIYKGIQAIRTPTPNELEKIPQISIRNGLYSQKDGSDNFDEYTLVVASNADWFLVKYMTEWIIPIPSGWTSISVIDGAFYSFAKADASETSFEIRIGIDCTDFDTSDEYLNNIEEDLSKEVSYEVLKKEIVDESKGYLYLVMQKEETENVSKLLIVTKSRGGCFYYLIATSDEKDWDDFYPIVRASVGNWFDLSNHFLGLSLPENLLD